MHAEAPPLRWTRSRTAPLAGVAGGIARALEIDPWLVRMVFVLTFFMFGTGLIFYVMCAIALPPETQSERGRQKMILGVCAHLDERGDMEVGLARLAALSLLLVSFGAAAVGYVVLYFIFHPTGGSRPEKQSPRI